MNWWQFLLGNVVTGLIIGGLFLFRRGMDWKGMTDRMASAEKWQKEHMEDCQQRDKQIKLLTESNIQVAATLEYMGKTFEASERRLSRMEDEFWVPKFSRK